MEESIEYCRAVGYFHSSIFCYITNGLYPFIQHGGRMRIVCSVNVSPEDEHQIALGYDIRQLLEDKIAPATQELIDLNIANIKNLCWLIKNNRLDIKVCLRKDPNTPGAYRLFHEKFGIFKDADENAVSFLGSVNETLGGWINNEESFEVPSITFIAYPPESTPTSNRVPARRMLKTLFYKRTFPAFL